MAGIISDFGLPRILSRAILSRLLFNTILPCPSDQQRHRIGRYFCNSLGYGTVQALVISNRRHTRVGWYDSQARVHGLRLL